jgi:hypothetical protein
MMAWPPFAPNAGVPARPAPAPVRRRRPRHHHFHVSDDRRLEQIMERSLSEGGKINWSGIAREMGSGFTARQVMERWMCYLGPGINRGEFTIEERRECLKHSVRLFGDWGSIASRIGGGTQRTAPQVKGVIVAMHHKLQRLQISLREPSEVDALPDSFFERAGSNANSEAIRNHFFRECEALQARSEAPLQE